MSNQYQTMIKQAGVETNATFKAVICTYNSSYSRQVPSHAFVVNMLKYNYFGQIVFWFKTHTNKLSINIWIFSDWSHYRDSVSPDNGNLINKVTLGSMDLMDSVSKMLMTAHTHMQFNCTLYCRLYSTRDCAQWGC